MLTSKKIQGLFEDLYACVWIPFFETASIIEESNGWLMVLSILFM